MGIEGFREYLISRNFEEDDIEAALENVRELKDYLDGMDGGIDNTSVENVRSYFRELVETGKNSMQRFIDLARYFYFTGQHQVYIYIISTFSGLEVLDSISEKLISEMGTDCQARIFDGLRTPPLGSPPETYVDNTLTMVQRLIDEGEDTCHEILADNHHGIPRESFAGFAEIYRRADSIDDFLRELHEERVRELQRHVDEGKAWYEQEITPEVVELVKNDQELLSAVRKGDYLYFTKIPYAPKDWLIESDPVRKRYLACHCPLARGAILREDMDIPMDWCYCSGGFHKWMYDVLFNELTEVEVLESVLAGDDRCRFRIRLP